MRCWDVPVWFQMLTSFQAMKLYAVVVILGVVATSLSSAIPKEKKAHERVKEKVSMEETYRILLIKRTLPNRRALLDIYIYIYARYFLMILNRISLLNCPQISVTGLYWWLVNIDSWSGNGLVPSNKKPVPEPMFTQIYRPQCVTLK